MDERLVSSEADNHESVIEQSLRPQNLAQYIGQHKVKENLRVFIDAAKMRQETFQVRAARTEEHDPASPVSFSPHL